MIPFNKLFVTGDEFANIHTALESNHISGDGQFTKKCHQWLENQIGCRKALLTHSCTAALEMAAILAEIGPGDEVIMPSFTFVSTANAFVLRGGVPVFVDIEMDTLNIDVTKIEAALTKKSKAVVPVHYAGVACEMDAILALASKHDLIVIEDAAQAILSTYHGKPTGSLGEMAALSFHETKNLICGEGGALLLNNEQFIARAEIIREKGTNRSSFHRGDVDKYTWIDIGSSYLPSDLIAAFLWAQLQSAREICERRLKVWHTYHDAFADLEQSGKLRRPVIPDGIGINGHLYYILLPTAKMQAAVLDRLKRYGVSAVFHYIPLHSSPAGRKYGKHCGCLANTDSVSERLVRLPLWVELSGAETMEVIDAVCRAVVS
jgi:dTDP-4-amino-4,6-dideoxygalactose transaminase